MSKKDYENFYKKNGYLIEDGKPVHREVYKQKNKIPKGWHIHHVDFVKTNNHIDNLIAVPPKIHNRIHKIAKAGNIICLAVIKKWIKEFKQEKVTKNIDKKKRKPKKSSFSGQVQRLRKKLKNKKVVNSPYSLQKRKHTKSEEERQQELKLIEEFMQKKKTVDKTPN